MGQESLEKGKELVELHSKPLQEGSVLLFSLLAACGIPHGKAAEGWEALQKDMAIKTENLTETLQQHVDEHMPPGSITQPLLQPLLSQSRRQSPSRQKVHLSLGENAALLKEGLASSSAAERAEQAPSGPDASSSVSPVFRRFRCFWSRFAPHWKGKKRLSSFSCRNNTAYQKGLASRGRFRESGVVSPIMLL